jgi:hypothetical protein
MNPIHGFHTISAQDGGRSLEVHTKAFPNDWIVLNVECVDPKGMG